MSFDLLMMRGDDLCMEDYKLKLACSVEMDFTVLANQMQVTGTSSSKLLTLPPYILEDICNRLAIENASYIASAICVCKSFKEAGSRVRSVRLICLNRYHEALRAGVTLSNLSTCDSKGEASTSTVQEQQQQQQQQQQTSVSSDEEGSGDEKSLFIFRNVVVDFLKGKPLLFQIRIEIEAKLQSKTVPEGERGRTDFWLSDPFHLIRWIPSVRATLQHLCIVDYGQQAIMRRTSILRILSQNCEFGHRLFNHMKLLRMSVWAPLCHRVH